MVTRYVAARLGTGPRTVIALEVTSQYPWPEKADAGPLTSTFTSRVGGVVPAGTYRKVRFTSQVEVPPAGAAFEDCDMPAGLLVRRNDTGPVTLSRCRIVSSSWSSVTGLTAQRCQILGSGSDILHITSDSGRLCTGITIRDCWIGDAVLAPRDHLDGIQVRGVSGLTIERCSIDIGPWRTTTEGGLNAAVFLENDNGDNRNVTIRDCYLNGGSYTLMVGTGGHSGLRLTGNRFGTDGRHGAAVLTQVTPTQCVDNLYLATGRQASGLPIIP